MNAGYEPLKRVLQYRMQRGACPVSECKVATVTDSAAAAAAAATAELRIKPDKDCVCRRR